MRFGARDTGELPDHDPRPLLMVVPDDGALAGLASASASTPAARLPERLLANAV